MPTPARVFELRTYHVAPGRFDALQERFRNHTLALFNRHGLTVIGFWTPQGAGDLPIDTLVYLLAFSDREAAEQAWTDLRADPVWVQVKADSERKAGGSLTTAIESVFLTATDYSPII